MKWVYLSLALLLESLGFIALKYSQGLTKAAPTITTIIIDIFSLLFYILALKKFETSFVYMIGAGVGTTLIVLANTIVFKQNLNWVQIISIILIIIGSVGLQSQGNIH